MTKNQLEAKVQSLVHELNLKSWADGQDAAELELLRKSDRERRDRNRLIKKILKIDVFSF